MATMRSSNPKGEAKGQPSTTGVDVNDFAKVVQGMNRLLTNLANSEPFKRANIGVAEWSALKAIGGRNDTTGARLAKTLGVSSQRINQLIDGLKTDGCVAIVVSQDDKRKKLISLTSEGRAKIATLDAELLPFISNALNSDGRPVARAIKGLRGLSKIGAPAEARPEPVSAG